MSSNDSGERRRRRTGVSRRKQLSKHSTSTKLWLADEQVLQEIASRKDTNPGQLLRKIVHQWATTMRVSGQAREATDAAGPIQKLHRQIIAEEIAPLREILSTILGLLSDEVSTRVSANANTPDARANTPDSTLLLLIEKLAEELKATKEELRMLKAFAIAQHRLSGQSFAAAWANLKFLQHYLVVPTLQREPARAKNAQQIVTTDSENLRREALDLLKEMDAEFGYPEPYEVVLIVP
jgi:hypothetical protein